MSPAPGRPMLPVSRARSASAATVAAPRGPLRDAGAVDDGRRGRLAEGHGRRAQQFGVHAARRRLSGDVDALERLLRAAKPSVRASMKSLSARPSVEQMAHHRPQAPPGRCPASRPGDSAALPASSVVRGSMTITVLPSRSALMTSSASTG